MVLSPRTNASFSEALGILPIEEEKKDIAVIPEANTSNIVELTIEQTADYDLSRKVFKELIQKGNDTITDLADLARDLESPRAYEVLATMMKTTAEITKDLFDLHKKTKDLKTVSQEYKRVDETSITVEKAVFVGTTTDLLNQVKYGGENTIDGKVNGS